MIDDLDEEKIKVINEKVSGDDNHDKAYIKIMKKTTRAGTRYDWDFKILSTNVQDSVKLNEELKKMFMEEENGDNGNY